jgi:hypothetical protein
LAIPVTSLPASAAPATAPFAAPVAAPTSTVFRAFFACFRIPGDERFLALFLAARFFVPPFLDDADFLVEEADVLGVDFFFVAFFAADFLVVFLAAMVTPFELN